jgi:hypothetical protein
LHLALDHNQFKACHISTAWIIACLLLLFVLLQAHLNEAEQTLQQAVRDKIDVMEELSQAQVGTVLHPVWIASPWACCFWTFN